MVRYRIYPLQSIFPTTERYHSNLRQEQTLVPLQGEHGAAALSPPLDVREDADAFHVVLETPGLTREDLRLSLQENILTIKGHKAAPPVTSEQTPRNREREYGDFSRDVLLPCDVQSDAVKAHLENGILMITLPKQEAAKPRKIPIRSVKDVDAETYNAGLPEA